MKTILKARTALERISIAEECVDVVVIGGGPAGMMAAARAGARGLSVILLEKNEGLGKKLLITGGGRCNVTNNKPDVRTLLARYKGAGKFLFSAFAHYSVSEAIEFFESRNVPLKEENEGRLFPESNTARSIYGALIAYVKEGNVDVRTKHVVTALAKDKNEFMVSLQAGKAIRARSCVLATGGTSRPETGSTGEGFGWLTDLGHTVVPNDFALVPLELRPGWTMKLGGVTLPHVKLTIFADGKKIRIEKGKLLFTHVGVTGPTILNMSREVGDLLAYSEVVIALDLFPDLDAGALRTRLQELLTEGSNKKLKNVLGSLVSAALVGPILALAGVDGETASHSVRSEDRKKLCGLLQALPLEVKGLLGANKAVVSSGGADLKEINLKTMESRLVHGLYLVGDVLNVDRPSGGYSLQLCWTTGFVAGSHA